MKGLQRIAALLITLSVLSSGLICLAEQVVNQPLSLHPENPRYFLFRGKPTLLVTSGEHYGALINLDFDYAAYLDELADCGLNHTRVFMGAYRETAASFEITDNTLAPAKGRFLCPWAPTDEPSGSEWGDVRYDLKRFNSAYFERLKDLLRKAAQRGIVVELTLFCPMYNDEIWAACPMNAQNNINGLGDCGRKEVLDLKNQPLLEVQRALVRKIVSEVQGFDNLYLEVCNEPYTQDVPDSWQTAIVGEIAAEQKDRSRRHLISRNIASKAKRAEALEPEVSILNFHYCVPPEMVSLNYDLERAVGENETGFRGKVDAIYRTQGWNSILAGAAIYNNLDYSFSIGHEDGSFVEYKSPGGGSRKLREQLGFLKGFMDQCDFVAMAPSDDIVVHSPKGFRTTVLANAGREYAIYCGAALKWKPDQEAIARLEETVESRQITLALPDGEYRYEWLDPVTGESIERDRFRHEGGDWTIETPAFAIDIAMRIESL